MVADHLSRISNAPMEMAPINENFPDEHILVMCKEPLYADYELPCNRANTFELVKSGQALLFNTDTVLLLREPYLFKYCPNQIIRRRLPEDEHHSVLTFRHEFACGGHFGL